METGQHDTNSARRYSPRLFGELLISKGLLTQQQLSKAIDEQRKFGGRIGEAIVRLGMMTEEQVARVLAEQLSMEYFDISDISAIDLNISQMLDKNIAKRFCVVVVGKADDKYVVAMADPFNITAIETISQMMKRPVKVVISPFHEIRRTIDMIYHGADDAQQQAGAIVDTAVKQ